MYEIMYIKMLLHNCPSLRQIKIRMIKEKRKPHKHTRSKEIKLQKIYK